MGVLREELRHNLLNAGAAIVGFGSLRGNEKLPYPALPQVVSYAVKLEPAGDTIWDFARATSTRRKKPRSWPSTLAPACAATATPPK